MIAVLTRAPERAYREREGTRGGLPRREKGKGKVTSFCAPPPCGRSVCNLQSKGALEKGMSPGWAPPPGRRSVCDLQRKGALAEGMSSGGEVRPSPASHQTHDIK